MTWKRFQLLERIWKFLCFHVKEGSRSDAQAAYTSAEVWEMLLEMGGRPRKIHPPQHSNT